MIRNKFTDSKNFNMKKALILPVSLLITGMLLSTGCSKDNGGSGGGGGSTTVNCATVTNKAFAADVNPIIQASCALVGCHAAGSSNGPGPLTTYAQISGNASAIRSAVSSGRMPQGSSLSTAQKNSIICWIDSGSPNN